MEFKGTKGEWNVKKYKMTFPSALKWQIINENDDALFEVHLAESNEAMEANAKLIASAPDLLEALQEIQIDLSILKSNFIQIEKTDSRAEGMTDIIDKWIERNKKAIEKALK